MHRTLGQYSHQAFGITTKILENMLGATVNNMRVYRDRALLLLAYDSLCRRSELVSIRIADIQVDKLDNQSQMKIHLRKSKTDQELR